MGTDPAEKREVTGSTPVPTTTFDDAVAGVVAAYPDQSDSDHQALVAAIESDTLQAEHGL